MFHYFTMRKCRGISIVEDSKDKETLCGGGIREGRNNK